MPKKETQLEAAIREAKEIKRVALQRAVEALEQPYKQYLSNLVYDSQKNNLKFRVEDHAGNELGRAVDMKSAIEIFKERYPYSSDIDAKPFIYEI